MITIEEYKQIIKNEELPLLSLNDFFKGNKHEDSIAPNQDGFGRPALLEIEKKMQEIESMYNVAWVRVSLHEDTEIVEINGKEELLLSGESIIICTSMTIDELENSVDIEWLCSDGIEPISISDLQTYYSCIPAIPDRYECFEIVWD